MENIAALLMCVFWLSGRLGPNNDCAAIRVPLQRETRSGARSRRVGSGKGLKRIKKRIHRVARNSHKESCVAKMAIKPGCRCGSISLVGPEVQRPFCCSNSREKSFFLPFFSFFSVVHFYFSIFEEPTRAGASPSSFFLLCFCADVLRMNY